MLKVFLWISSAVFLVLAVVRTIYFMKHGYSGPITYFIPMYYLLALVFGLLGLFCKSTKSIWIILGSLLVLLMLLGYFFLIGLARSW
jgi:hypothetical protein